MEYAMDETLQGKDIEKDQRYIDNIALLAKYDGLVALQRIRDALPKTKLSNT